jgi:hypothetical protein
LYQDICSRKLRLGFGKASTDSISNKSFKEKRMVDFRKCLLLATAALAAGVGSASAQTAAPFCTATTGAPPTLRAEGQAELTGAITLSCTNIPAALTVNFDVLLNNGTVPITSDPGEALVTVVKPGNPTTSVPFAPIITNGSFVNDARFAGVPIPVGSSTITFSGIRANVTPTYVPVAASSGFGQVLAVLSVSGGALPISQVNGGFFVGVVLPGLGTITSTGLQISACGTTTPIPTGAFLTLSIPELFPTAFKTILPQTTSSNPDSESGPSPILPTQVADSATQFAVTFTNLPSGATFYIPTTIASFAQGSSSAAATGIAVLVAGSGSAIPQTPITPTPGGLPSVLPTASPAVSTGFVAVTANTTVYYNVVSTSPNITETFALPVYVTGTIGASTSSTVSVVLAPIGTAATATAPTTNFPAPRFISLTTSPAIPAINLVPCQTSLLFPFLANTAGYDTGVSIGATSQDPFGTPPLGGTCTLNLYGTNAPTTALAPLAVAAGTTSEFVLSNVAPGFEGYMIAVCNFNYAHGFAFVSGGFDGVGNAGLSDGYTANVINDRLFTVNGATYAVSTDTLVPNHPEMLGN